jgi:hypothetical protein
MHALLLPFLRFCLQQKWQCTVHVDRLPRPSESGWPSLEDRRWGPPTRAEQYLSQADRKPSDAVLLCVRGPGAGALLSFYMGRFHFQPSGGELLLRHVTSRDELRESDWSLPRLRELIDRPAARREPLVFEIDEAEQTVTLKGETPVPALEAGQIFERWSSLLFERIVSQARAEQPFSQGPE